jgi:predicted TIM-barrel fold metal-dependent hydrolase
LQRLAKLLDEFPNVTLDAGAVLYDFGRQPRAAREFFVKYQDRIMFGKDSYQPDEFPYYWRVFETADEYFDYYRDYHATWKMYGMALPDDVLKKVYYQNAVKTFKGMPATGWPQ